MSGFLTFCIIPASIFIVLPILLFKKRKNPSLLRILASFCLFFLISMFCSYTLIGVEAFGSYDTVSPENYTYTVCGYVTSSYVNYATVGEINCLGYYYWSSETLVCSKLSTEGICLIPDQTRSQIQAKAERDAASANEKNKRDDQKKYLNIFAVPLFFFGVSFAIIYFRRRNHPTMRSRDMFKRSPQGYTKVQVPTIKPNLELPDNGYRLFISYSRSDTNFAERLGADLRQHGIETWRDAENIPLGSTWDQEIEKSIEQCTHLIFVATPDSVKSQNVQDELSLALNKGKTIIPIMVQTCELPMRVHRMQWVDFRTNYEKGLVELLTFFG